jgi:hypothetical protein
MGFMDMKKKGKPLSDREIEAKTKVVQAMRDMAASQMGDKLKGLKKVTVASNDPAGLKEGLEKAKQLISKKPGDDEDESMEDPMEEASETPEEEASEEKDENSHDMPMHSSMTIDHGSDDHESEEGSDEFAHMDEQELDEKLQELMAAKAKLSARK